MADDWVTIRFDDCSPLEWVLITHDVIKVSKGTDKLKAAHSLGLHINDVEEEGSWQDDIRKKVIERSLR